MDLISLLDVRGSCRIRGSTKSLVNQTALYFNIAFSPENPTWEMENGVIFFQGGGFAGKSGGFGGRLTVESLPDFSPPSRQVRQGTQRV